jgi:hypothetical protein
MVSPPLLDSCRAFGEAEAAAVAYNLACNEKQPPLAMPNVDIFLVFLPSPWLYLPL